MTGTLEKVTTYKQFIGGNWVDAASGETLEVENPANEQVVGRVPASGDEDVDRAVKAAASAFETWGSPTPQQRMPLLLTLAAIVHRNPHELAPLHASQTANPLNVAPV